MRSLSASEDLVSLTTVISFDFCLNDQTRSTPHLLSSSLIWPCLPRRLLAAHLQPRRRSSQASFDHRRRLRHCRAPWMPLHSQRCAPPPLLCFQPSSYPCESPPSRHRAPVAPPRTHRDAPPARRRRSAAPPASARRRRPPTAHAAPALPSRPCAVPLLLHTCSKIPLAIHPCLHSRLRRASQPSRACAGSSLSVVERRLHSRRLHSRRASKAATKAPRKQLATKAARKSAPATGGVKKPHRCSAPHSTAAPRLITLLLLTSAAASRCASHLICCKVPNPSNPSP
ncbi:nucleosomal DNA binding [Sarracenia purpurea var. burkii]